MPTNGQPVPPPFATRLDRDTRLKTDEKHSLAVTNIPEHATHLKATLTFALLPPPMAQKLGLPWLEAQPKQVLEAELAL